MGLILWIIFGAIAGWIASVIMKTNVYQGFLGDIFLGILGAIIGGFMISFLGGTGITGFNLYSLIVAVIGACTAIFIGRRIWL